MLPNNPAALEAKAASLFLVVCPESGELLFTARKPPVPAYEMRGTPKELAALRDNPEEMQALLGTQSTPGNDADEKIKNIVTEEVKRFLPLLRKMGGVVCGFEKCRATLRKGEAYCLAQASDGSEREQGRLAGGRDNLALRLWTAKELGAIFGRETVHHAVITKRAAKGAFDAKVASWRLWMQNTTSNEHE